MSFTTKYDPSHAGSDVVETLTQSDLIQIDPQRDIVFEIPPPDVVSSISHYFETAVNGGSNAESSPSDSDSLFLTQSVAPVVRTVKRHQSSERPAPPISVDSEDEHEDDHNQDDKPHQEERRETLQKRDLDSENSDDDLIGKTRTALTRGGESRHRRRPRSARRPAPPRPMREAFPFLQKRHSGQISVHKNHVLVNSVIGGFFKCIENIKKARQERIELCSSKFPFVLREDEMELDEDDEDDIDDIKKVDAECFVLNTRKRNRESWFPKERWKLKLESKKHERKSNRDEAKTREKGDKEDLEKPREQMQSCTESSSVGTEIVSKRREKRDRICTRSASRSLLCPPASPNRSVFIAQEEDDERQPEILVACTQTQSMDWHCGDHSGLRVARGRENMEAAGPESETVVEETQRPDSQDEASEGHAPGTLEDGLRETGLERGDWMYSQDLFAQQDNLADEVMESRTLKECRIRERNEDLESCVMQNDDICLFGNNRNTDKPSDLSLDQVDGSLVGNAKLLRSSQSKILSPRTNKINLAKKENHKKQPTDGNVTLSCPDENGHDPSLSDVDPAVHPTLVNDASGSKVKVDSSSCRDISTGIQETVDTPLFNYGGLSFLKRKTKRTKSSKVSSGSTLLQPSTDQNKSVTSLAEDSGSETLRKKRRNLVNTDNEDEMITSSALLVEAGVTLPKNTGSVDKVSELKPKEKRKRHRDVQSLLPVDGAYVEEGVYTSTQTPHHAPVSVADGHKKLRVTDLSSPSRNYEYSSPRVHGDVSENVLPLVNFESQRKKRKKAKKGNLRPELYGEVIVQCDGELDVGHDTGTKNSKRKMPGSDLDDRCVERQSGEIADIQLQSESPVGSLNSGEAACFIERPTDGVYQKTDDLVTPRKKKKKKEVLRNVEALEQFETPEETQDSEQPAANVIPDTKVKKKKHRSTCQNTEVSHEEDGMETPCTSDSVDPPRSGMGLNHQGNSSEIHEEGGGYGPDCFDGSTSLKKKKKKKRKTLENGFSVASDVIGSTEGSRADLNLNGSEPEQSVSQTEELHEPERQTKKKKKKKERRSEPDRNMGGDLCDDDAECLGYQQILQGSPLTTSETTVKKKRKKKSRCDVTDSDQNTCPALPQELKMVENTREVLVTQHDKEPQKEGSVASLLKQRRRKMNSIMY